MLETSNYYENSVRAEIMPYEELLDERRLDEQLRVAHLDEEMRLASEVQLSLLPKSAPQLDGLDIAGLNVPAGDVGGDYFDFIPIAAGQLGLVVADVSGKGVPASLIMASFRAFLRAEVKYNYAIRTIFAKVNNFLREMLQPHQFVTAFYGVLDLERRRFTYSNAGHHSAILLRTDGARQCLNDGGTVLGIFKEASYSERFVDLLPGDLLVLYTDGLIEAADRTGEMFNHRRLKELVRAHEHLNASELCEALYAEMRRFTGNHRLEDDTTIVVAKLLAPEGIDEH